MSESSADRAPPVRAAMGPRGLAAQIAPTVKRLRFAHRGGAAAMAVLIALGCNHPADAATLAGATMPAGFLAALASLWLIASWQADLPVGMFAGLFVLGAVFWLWRGMSRWPAPARSDRSTVVHTAAAQGAECLSASTVMPPALQCIEPGVLLVELKSHFMRLQSAWDAGDLAALRELTTTEMFDELCASRAGCLRAAAPAAAEVLALHAELLCFEAHDPACVVGIEFSGLRRESAQDGALPFREVWMLAAPGHGVRAWRLARHQALL